MKRQQITLSFFWFRWWFRISMCFSSDESVHFYSDFCSSWFDDMLWRYYERCVEIVRNGLGDLAVGSGARHNQARFKCLHNPLPLTSVPSPVIRGNYWSLYFHWHDFWGCVIRAYTNKPVCTKKKKHGDGDHLEELSHFYWISSVSRLKHLSVLKNSHREAYIKELARPIRFTSFCLGPKNLRPVLVRCLRRIDRYPRSSSEVVRLRRSVEPIISAFPCFPLLPVFSIMATEPSDETWQASRFKDKKP